MRTRERSLSPAARRGPSRNEDPPADPRIVHEYVAPFTNADGQADLVVQSRDGKPFAVQSAVLRLHSAKLRTKVPIVAPIGQVKNEDGQLGPRPAGELPVVTLRADADVLCFFLRHLVPDAYLVNGEPPRIPDYRQAQGRGSSLLKGALSLCVSYQCPHILDVVARIHLPAYAQAYPLAAWATAARFGRIDEARDAIRVLGRPQSFVFLEGARRWDAQSGKAVDGRRDKDISDLPVDVIAKTPISSIRSFCAARVKVVASAGDGKYTWANAADDFEL